jgi:EAL domain-containing protein (putative c-di-GMP-specific phosphodiesterase class I)
MRVLVVDDNDGNVAFVRQLLEQQGLTRIRTETDSREVGRHLVEHRPDLVLLDLQMPHVDGFEVLAQIRRFAAGSYLPVLVLTADHTTASRNRALAEGAQDLLSKPLDVVEATLRIANLLQTRQLYATLHRERGATETGPDRSVDDRAKILERVRNVLQETAIMPVFQPVVDLSTLEPVGHEGLSRFADTSRGGPDRWFADAFGVGLGVEMEWMAAKAMLDYFDVAAPGAFLAINMSPATIMHLGENHLCSTDLWHRLVIEITEHVPVEDYRALRRALDEMREHGTRLAADDFGSGYAGLRQLIGLQPDIIKLDMSLVAGVDQNHGQHALISALVTFAHDIGATVVAEGIEQTGELQVLQQLGVDYGQGYLLGRPAAIPLRVTV